MPVHFIRTLVPDSILLQALIPALIFGTLNWIYWRRKGYRSFETFFLSYCAFYGISFLLLKVFH